MLLWRPLSRIAGWEVVVGRRITAIPVLRAAWVAVPRVLPVVLIHDKSCEIDQHLKKLPLSPVSLEREPEVLPCPFSLTAPPLEPRWDPGRYLLARSDTRTAAGSCRSASSRCTPPRRTDRCPAGLRCPSTPSCWCTATKDGFS